MDTYEAFLQDYYEALKTCAKSDSATRLESQTDILRKLELEMQCDFERKRDAVDSASVQVVEATRRLGVDRYEQIGWTWRLNDFEGDILPSERDAYEDAFRFLELSDLLHGNCERCGCFVIDPHSDEDGDLTFCSLECAEGK